MSAAALMGRFRNLWATKLPCIALCSSARPYAEGTCGSQLCFKGDLGQIEHKMTSNWPLDTTAPH